MGANKKREMSQSLRSDVEAFQVKSNRCQFWQDLNLGFRTARCELGWLQALNFRGLVHRYNCR